MENSVTGYNSDKSSDSQSGTTNGNNTIPEVDQNEGGDQANFQSSLQTSNDERPFVHYHGVSGEDANIEKAKKILNDVFKSELFLATLRTGIEARGYHNKHNLPENNLAYLFFNDKMKAGDVDALDIIKAMASKAEYFKRMDRNISHVSDAAKFAIELAGLIYENTRDENEDKNAFDSFFENITYVNIAIASLQAGSSFITSKFGYEAACLGHLSNELNDVLGHISQHLISSLENPDSKIDDSHSDDKHLGSFGRTVGTGLNLISMATTPIKYGIETFTSHRTYLSIPAAIASSIGKRFSSNAASERANVVGSDVDSISEALDGKVIGLLRGGMDEDQIKKIINKVLVGVAEKYIKQVDIDSAKHKAIEEHKVSEKYGVLFEKVEMRELPVFSEPNLNVANSNNNDGESGANSVNRFVTNNGISNPNNIDIDESISRQFSEDNHSCDHADGAATTCLKSTLGRARNFIYSIPSRITRLLDNKELGIFSYVNSVRFIRGESEKNKKEEDSGLSSVSRVEIERSDITPQDVRGRNLSERELQENQGRSKQFFEESHKKSDNIIPKNSPTLCERANLSSLNESQRR